MSQGGKTDKLGIFYSFFISPLTIYAAFLASFVYHFCRDRLLLGGAADAAAKLSTPSYPIALRRLDPPSKAPFLPFEVIPWTSHICW
jgi:hypothetical protein